jgi:hypothetical protein
MRTRGSRLCSSLARGRFVLGLGLGLVDASVACAGRPPTELSPLAPGSGGASGRERPRAPDGVVVDPSPLSPPAVVRGSARGVVALREPAGDDAVVELIQAFLDGWQHESLDALLALAAPDAGLIDGSDHGHAALVESWRQRLRAHDYGRLDGADLVRPERIERWEWDELGTPQSPPRPVAMHPGEVLVRAPLEVTRVGGERVFGDVVVMILKRQNGRLRIAAYGENDAR